MASASVTMLTQGWGRAQRVAVLTVLDERQRRIVRDRIRMDVNSTSGVRHETHEAEEAIRFLDSGGADGTSSFGIVEYTAAVLFGADPVFRSRWQAVRRGETPDAAADDDRPWASRRAAATTVASALSARPEALPARRRGTRLTIRDQLIRGLERLGYRRDPQRINGKYLIFIDHVRPGNQRLFVGKMAALRGGAYVDGSMPMNGLKAKALAAGLPDRYDLPIADGYERQVPA